MSKQLETPVRARPARRTGCRSSTRPRKSDHRWRKRNLGSSAHPSPFPLARRTARRRWPRSRCIDRVGRSRSRSGRDRSRAPSGNRSRSMPFRRSMFRATRWKCPQLTGWSGAAACGTGRSGRRDVSPCATVPVSDVTSTQAPELDPESGHKVQVARGAAAGAALAGGPRRAGPAVLAIGCQPKARPGTRAAHVRQAAGATAGPAIACTVRHSTGVAADPAVLRIRSWVGTEGAAGVRARGEALTAPPLHWAPARTPLQACRQLPQLAGFRGTALGAGS